MGEKWEVVVKVGTECEVDMCDDTSSNAVRSENNHNKHPTSLKLKDLEVQSPSKSVPI